MLRATVRTRLSEQFNLDVQIEAPPGITIVFGASGSGKSTLLRLVAGLARPDSGRAVPSLSQKCGNCLVAVSAVTRKR